jgi:hypothetical protein
MVGVTFSPPKLEPAVAMYAPPVEGLLTVYKRDTIGLSNENSFT